MSGSGPSAQEIEELRRRSGVALGADGRFTYRGRSVENDRVQELFHAGVDVRDDGRVTLTVGRFMAYPEIATVARFLCRASWTAHGGRGVLAGGREVDLTRAVIGYGPDERFYLWIEGLRGPACALREAHQALAGWIAEDPEGRGGAVALLAAIPAPDAAPPHSAPPGGHP